MKKKSIVGILMGSDSDLPILKGAAEVLDQFKVPYEITVVSAHRTPQRMYEYAQNAAQRGVQLIIAGAGGAAHLPGMVAAITHLPVIGVPVKTSQLDGLDSLLSIAQMPQGIPVATVAINGSKNAGLLACRILALHNASLAQSIIQYQKKIKISVESKAKKLEKNGFVKYLKNMEGNSKNK